MLLLDTFGISFSVIIPAETWYAENFRIFNPPGYQSSCRSRLDRRRGGVSILMEKDIIPEELAEFCAVAPDYEVLTSRAQMSYYCVLYRPLSGECNNIVDFLENLFG